MGTCLCCGAAIASGAAAVQARNDLRDTGWDAMPETIAQEHEWYPEESQCFSQFRSGGPEQSLPELFWSSPLWARSSGPSANIPAWSISNGNCRGTTRTQA